MKNEWLILPALRQGVAHTAELTRLFAIAAAVGAGLDPLLWICGLSRISGMIGNVSEVLYLVSLSAISLLAPWCHEVLLAGRGFIVTRATTLVGAVVGVFQLIGTLYLLIAREPLFAGQAEYPFYIGLLLCISLLPNLNNMAAAPLRRRIALSAAAVLILMSGLMFGIHELILPYTILKTAACLLLINPLASLHHAAPRIVSLPDPS